MRPSIDEGNQLEYRAALVHDAPKQSQMQAQLRNPVLKQGSSSISRGRQQQERSPEGKTQPLISKGSIERLHQGLGSATFRG